VSREEAIAKTRSQDFLKGGKLFKKVIEKKKAQLNKKRNHEKRRIMVGRSGKDLKSWKTGARKKKCSGKEISSVDLH